MPWDSIVDELQREGPLIAQAPMSFSIAFVVMSCLIGFCFYKVFRVQLDRKNELIADLKTKIDISGGNLPGEREDGIDENPSTHAGTSFDIAKKEWSGPVATDTAIKQTVTYRNPPKEHKSGGDL